MCFRVSLNFCYCLRLQTGSSLLGAWTYVLFIYGLIAIAVSDGKMSEDAFYWLAVSGVYGLC